MLLDNPRRSIRFAKEHLSRCLGSRGFGLRAPASAFWRVFRVLGCFGFGAPVVLFWGLGALGLGHQSPLFGVQRFQVGDWGFGSRV